MDINKLQALLKSKKQETSGAYKERAISPQAGVRNRYRILPGWDAANPEVFWQDFGQHYIKGVDGKIKAVITCQDKSFGDVCPVCNAIDRAIPMTHDDMTLKLLESAKAGAKVLFNVVEPESDKPNEVKILAVAPSVFLGAGRGTDKVGGILQLIEEAAEEGINMFDLNEGFDIIIQKSGEGLSTRYSVSRAMKSKSVNPEVLKKLHNLKAYAEEAPSALTKAVGFVNASVGLLEAPAASGSYSAPRSAAPTGLDAVDMDVIEVAMSKIPETVVVDAAPVETVVAVAPVAAATAPVAAPTAKAGDDDDLAALVASLG